MNKGVNGTKFFASNIDITFSTNKICQQDIIGRGKMIRPICSLCRKELDDFGAIVLSPPDDNHKIEKYHICKACYCNNIFLLFYRNFDLLKGEK